jgi:hypothetical protein
MISGAVKQAENTEDGKVSISYAEFEDAPKNSDNGSS